MKNTKLKKGQLYYMIFSSGNRDYFSIGSDLDIMANNILKRYNAFCSEYDKVKTLVDMAKIAQEEEYSFNTYIINQNAACDMDYRTFDNEIFVGDYLGYVEKIGLNEQIINANKKIEFPLKENAGLNNSLGVSKKELKR